MHYKHEGMWNLKLKLSLLSVSKRIDCGKFVSADRVTLREIACGSPLKPVVDK